MTENKIKCGNLEIVLLYIGFMTVNSVVVWLANILFPNQVVLGTGTINISWALIHSMGTLALINIFTAPFGGKTERALTRLIVNFGGVWLVTRLAEDLGLGVSSWLVALCLAAVLSMVQKEVLRWVSEING